MANLDGFRAIPRRRGAGPSLCLCLALACALVCALAEPAAAGPRADAEVAFAQGLSAFNHGDDRAAVERFEEAVALDPDHGPAYHYLGLAYLRLGEPTRAAAAFTAALDARRPPWAPGEEVERQLAEARRLAPGEVPAEVAAPVYRGEDLGPRVRPRFEGRASLALGGDSNPGLVPADLLAVAPDGEEVEGATSDDVANVALRLAYHPFYDRRGWSLGLVAEGRQTLHQDLGFLDLGRARAVVQLAWGSDPLGYLTGPLGYARAPFGDGRMALLVQLGTTYYWLDGSSFFRTDEAALALVAREGRATATQLEADFRQVSAFAGGGAPRGRSGDEVEAGLSQWFFFGRRNRYLRLGAVAGERRAGDAFDAQWVAGRGEVSLPFGGRWVLYLSGEVRREEFDRLESNPFFPIFLAEEARQDRRTRLSAVLVWAASEKLRLTAGLTYIDRETDLGPAVEDLVDLGYERTAFSVGAHWFFWPGGEQ